MPTGEQKPIEPGFIQRAVQGLIYTIRGVGGPGDWFGPGSPMRGVAPDSVRGRAWDFPISANLQYTPRATEGVSFIQLRALADNFDLVRLAIETRKDQLSKMKFGIQPRKRGDDTVRSTPDDRCQKLEEFLRRPDRRRSWASWLRMLVEDMLVTDAATIYVRKTVGGDVYSLDVIDGATITPLIGADGRQPLPPDPAYTQVLKGMPAVEYSADELHYLSRNPRSNKIYGFSCVEQVIMIINIGLRRQVSVFQHYTEGNIPEALCGVPIDWQPDQIKQFQTYWDSLLEGNTAARRHMKFVPGDLKLQFTKDTLLKDEYDEWVARVVCYAFSVPNISFIKQINRATSETSKQAATEEGLNPLMSWVKDFMDQIIANDFGAPDLEFTWEDEEDTSVEVQSQIDIAEVANGIRSLDEVRVKRGLAPYGIGPFIKGIGPVGIIMIDDLKDPAKRAAILTPPAPGGMAPPGAPVHPGAALPPGHPAVAQAPSPALPAPEPQRLIGHNPAHQQALDTMQGHVSQTNLAPAGQPHQGVNPGHQAAIDGLNETLGGEPMQVAAPTLPPSYQNALTALQATLGR